MANILVAIDNIMPPADVVEYAVKVAKGTDSELILLGIVPIHIYNRWEARLGEIEEATKRTLDSVREMAERGGVKVTGMLRSGYPDEEIMKVSAEYDASVIIIPSGKNTASELCKTAAILLNEFTKTIKKPLVLVPV